MSVFDIIILVLVGLWAVVAVVAIFRNKAKGCCGERGCSGCCSNCSLSKKTNCPKRKNARK